jgi:hypothetical protein
MKTFLKYKCNNKDCPVVSLEIELNYELHDEPIRKCYSCLQPMERVF